MAKKYAQEAQQLEAMATAKALEVQQHSSAA